ncbi:MAG: ABC transporter ATP-binding protein [SAR324 cluster bacterium]|nr:ABC transporter ATP-binding protein [SAR324 cluster bacterium]
MTDAVKISIKNLSLSFGETKVLKDVSIEIEPGEFFSFLGPSGSGKSTLLRAIAGFGPRPEGDILIGNEKIVKLPPWERNVGMVFQSYALWPHMTIRKNVAFGLEERRTPKRITNEQVDEVLEMVGLLEFAERRPSQLSGGQQQRVALARTIVMKPRVLLLDEPLSNLDTNLRVQMRREILELQRKLKLTTIFVTHDQEEANTISDRIAVLNHGIIQQIGSPLKLYDEPTNRFVANFLGSVNLIDGVINQEDNVFIFNSAQGISFSLAESNIKQGSCTAMFRPQNLKITQKKKKLDPTAIQLSGKIEHREFLGSRVRYLVKVGEHLLLVDDTHEANCTTFEIGATASLKLESDMIRILNN